MHGFTTRLRAITPVLFPLVLWGSLWVSIQSGDLGKFFYPENLTVFLNQGLRAIFPLIAMGLVSALLIKKLLENPIKLSMPDSPLQFTVIYGGIGLFACLFSENVLYSFYWALVYVSVPLVLLVVVKNDLRPQVFELLLQITWLGLLTIAVVLFLLAFVKLDLAESIRNPISLYKCEPIGHWFTFSSGMLRSTGVGRYAAIAGIVSLAFFLKAGGLSASRRTPLTRIPWLALLVGALILLLSTGARTSIAGFGIASITIVLLYGGKKAVIVFIFLILILLPIGWSTGFHNDFINGCFFKGLKPNITNVKPELALSSISQSSDTEHIGPELSNPENPETIPSNREFATVPKILSTPSQQNIFHEPTPDAYKSGIDSKPIADVPKPTGLPTETPYPTETGTESNVSADAPKPTSLPTETPYPTETGTESNVSTDAPQQLIPREEPAEKPLSTKFPTATPMGSLQRTQPTQTIAAPKQILQTIEPDSAVPSQDEQDSPNSNSVQQTLKILIPENKPITPDRPSSVATALIPQPNPPELDRPSKAYFNLAGVVYIPRNYFEFSGRRAVWEQGISFIKRSPILGYGFQSDRLLLGTHMHNAVMQSLIQTGIIGGIAFIAAIASAWFLMFQSIRNRNLMPSKDHHNMILMAGLLSYFAIRSMLESSGAFFGIDWLILAPVLLSIEITGKYHNANREGQLVEAT